MSYLSYPSLYQINTRVWLTELSRKLGRAATLDDVPDDGLDRLAKQGFDWVWLLSMWRTGPAGQRVSRSNPDWRREFQETLPDLAEEDIAGSGFAIMDYTVHPSLGGGEALARVRERLRARGLRLMLDFVPNHTALDHPWVEDRPEYYVAGTETDLARAPQNYTRVKRAGGDRVLAYGRAPYFAGWPDTLQLDYSNPQLQEAMIRELERIAGQCDGVRCDMAMLVLPEVFERTWGRRPEMFWPKATKNVREQHPDFCFMAEVYWDMEWTLQQQGFDYTYDKRLYDRLREGHTRPVREHLHAALDYQNRLARFLENHDEPRAAAVFDPDVHRAAAVIAYSVPGLRFFHQGQFEGRKKRISPHLVRAPIEELDREIEAFYDRLLTVLRKPAVKSGEWQWLPCRPAWEGNGSWDAFVAHSWQGSGGERMLIAVNYAPQPSQCYLNLPFPEIKDRSVRLKDSLSSACYVREGNDLLERGLYLDLQPWSYHVFDLEVKPELVRALGATYHSGSVPDLGFEPDVIVECTGVGSVIADSIQKVGAGGVVCLTGVGAGGTAPRATADMAAAAVLKNNVIVGSVNANKRHWYKANERLGRLDRAWLSRLITRYEKPENFKQALERKPDDIKVVIQFGEV